MGSDIVFGKDYDLVGRDTVLQHDLIGVADVSLVSVVLIPIGPSD